MGNKILAEDINNIKEKIDAIVDNRNINDQITPININTQQIQSGAKMSYEIIAEILRPLGHFDEFPSDNLDSSYYNEIIGDEIVEFANFKNKVIKNLTNIYEYVEQKYTTEVEDIEWINEHKANNTDCRGNCAGLCTNACSGSCGSNCSGTCKGTCQSTCTGTCSGCSGGCQAPSCSTGCMWTCGPGGCTGTCQGACSNCGGSCSVSARYEV